MRFGSNRRADRTNRIVLSVLGLLLVVGSVAGLVASVVASTRDQPPIDEAPHDRLLANGTVIGLIALVVLALVVLAALAWFRRQLVPLPHADDVPVTADEGGRTYIEPDAITKVIEDELVELRGVEAATAHIRAGDPDTVEVLVDLDERASVDDVADEARSEVLNRARRALGRPELRLALEIRPVPVGAPPRAA